MLDMLLYNVSIILFATVFRQSSVTQLLRSRHENPMHSSVLQEEENSTSVHKPSVNRAHDSHKSESQTWLKERIENTRNMHNSWPGSHIQHRGSNFNTYSAKYKTQRQENNIDIVDSDKSSTITEDLLEQSVYYPVNMGGWLNETMYSDNRTTLEILHSSQMLRESFELLPNNSVNVIKNKSYGSLERIKLSDPRSTCDRHVSFNEKSLSQNPKSYYHQTLQKEDIFISPDDSDRSSDMSCNDSVSALLCSSSYHCNKRVYSTPHHPKLSVYNDHATHSSSNYSHQKFSENRFGPPNIDLNYSPQSNNRSHQSDTATHSIDRQLELDLTNQSQTDHYRSSIERNQSKNAITVDDDISLASKKFNKRSQHHSTELHSLSNDGDKRTSGLLSPEYNRLKNFFSDQKQNKDKLVKHFEPKPFFNTHSRLSSGYVSTSPSSGDAMFSDNIDPEDSYGRVKINESKRTGNTFKKTIMPENMLADKYSSSHLSKPSFNSKNTMQDKAEYKKYTSLNKDYDRLDNGPMQRTEESKNGSSFKLNRHSREAIQRKKGRSSGSLHRSNDGLEITQRREAYENDTVQREDHDETGYGYKLEDFDFSETESVQALLLQDIKETHVRSKDISVNNLKEDLYSEKSFLSNTTDQTLNDVKNLLINDLAKVHKSYVIPSTTQNPYASTLEEYEDLNYDSAGQKSKEQFHNISDMEFQSHNDSLATGESHLSDSLQRTTFSVASHDQNYGHRSLSSSCNLTEVTNFKLNKEETKEYMVQRFLANDDNDVNELLSIPGEVITYAFYQMQVETVEAFYLCFLVSYLFQIPYISHGTNISFRGSINLVLTYI